MYINDSFSANQFADVAIKKSSHKTGYSKS